MSRRFLLILISLVVLLLIPLVWRAGGTLREGAAPTASNETALSLPPTATSPAATPSADPGGQGSSETTPEALSETAVDTAADTVVETPTPSDIAPTAQADAPPAPTATPVPAAEVATVAPPTLATQSADGLSFPIRLPPGFAISVYARGVENARSLAISPSGTLFVGSRGAGRVYAVVDQNQDAVADEVITIRSGLNSPNGVAFHNGALYVAEINRILRFDNIEANLRTSPEPVVVNDSFPNDPWHGWKFIGIGPDNKLYVPVGAPCNVCEARSPFASITRMNLDGSGLETFASGVRNSVGFDWRPANGELWFTDNGRDNLGDDLPPDELNRAPTAGMNFGFPYCHAGSIADPEFGNLRPCSDFAPPAQALGPHVAALGMRFYTGGMFPAEYANQIFIAEHGSWNRSTPIGYRITLVRLSGDQPISYEVFADGWLEANGRVRGRPVDVEVALDGSLLISDDDRGMIYRISYTG